MGLWFLNKVVWFVLAAMLEHRAPNSRCKGRVWEIYYWDLRTLNNAKPYFFLNEMNKKTFLALLYNHCYSFHRTKWRLVTSIWQGPGPVATRLPFFSPKFKSAAPFSAPAQEGNLFFLSGRSAWKKIHNFSIKSSHLWQTWTHFWLSSSACDQCCTYQLICIWNWKPC